MFETATMIAAGYAGYAGWPWWSAALLGLVAAIWNVTGRLTQDFTMRGRGLVFMYVWTGVISAGLFLLINRVVYWLSH